jgi:hypothetical protein
MNLLSREELAETKDEYLHEAYCKIMGKRVILIGC